MTSSVLTKADMCILDPQPSIQEAEIGPWDIRCTHCNWSHTRVWWYPASCHRCGSAKHLTRTHVPPKGRER